MKQLYKFLVFVLYFIKNMIYFNKLIDIYINRQENQKVVNNYFVGTRVEISKANLFLYGLKKGLEKEAAELKVVLNFGWLENGN